MNWPLICFVVLCVVGCGLLFFVGEAYKKLSLIASTHNSIDRHIRDLVALKISQRRDLEQRLHKLTYQQGKILEILIKTEGKIPPLPNPKDFLVADAITRAKSLCQGNHNEEKQ